MRLILIGLGATYAMGFQIFRSAYSDENGNIGSSSSMLMWIFHIAIFLFVALIYYIYMNKKLKKEIKRREEAEHKLNHLINIDPMTNVFNRRYLEEINKKYFHKHQRKSDIASLMVLDLDHFKQINDNYGHNIGDKALKVFTAKMVELTRPTDIIVRLGGEEFMILLPETTLSDTQLAAEKIRQGCQKIEIFIDEEKSLTFAVSIGITSIDYSSDKKIIDTIARADQALYIAKDTGRNKCVTLESNH